MAVVVKYVVVRDGKEEMIFTTKKEAETYDKMLDIAERLNEFLQTATVDIAEDTLDELAFFMAQHRETIGKLLRGVTIDVPIQDAEAPEPEWVKEETSDAAPESPSKEQPKRARASKRKAVI